MATQSSIYFFGKTFPGILSEKSLERISIFPNLSALPFFAFFFFLTSCASLSGNFSDWFSVSSWYGSALKWKEYFFGDLEQKILENSNEDAALLTQPKNMGKGFPYAFIDSNNQETSFQISGAGYDPLTINQFNRGQSSVAFLKQEEQETAWSDQKELKQIQETPKIQTSNKKNKELLIREVNQSQSKTPLTETYEKSANLNPIAIQQTSGVAVKQDDLLSFDGKRFRANQYTKTVKPIKGARNCQPIFVGLEASFSSSLQAFSHFLFRRTHHPASERESFWSSALFSFLRKKEAVCAGREGATFGWERKKSTGLFGVFSAYQRAHLTSFDWRGIANELYLGLFGSCLEEQSFYLSHSLIVGGGLCSI